MPSCPHCGAMLKPTAEQCEYCGSPVEVRKVGAGSFSAKKQQVFFKRVSIFTMLVLTLVTTGLYAPLWFLFRKNSLRSLVKEKARKVDFLIYLLSAFWGLVFFLSYAVRNNKILIEEDILNGLWGIGWFLFVLMSFYVRLLFKTYILNGENGETALGVLAVPSLFWTLIFSVFHLQAQINRMIRAGILGDQRLLL